MKVFNEVFFTFAYCDLMNMKKVSFYTLGCKLNFSETSTLSRMFESNGYQKVNFTESPDIFIINTCSVTENADKKCRKIVREARSISPGAFIALVGCYAQLKPKEISEIPGVDAVLGAAEKFRLMELLEGFERKNEPVMFVSDINEAIRFNPSWSIKERTRTFLKVQDGCNYGCAFCTIPLARGKSRSALISNVVDSAKEISGSGVKEIVLTGVNTGDFGIQNGRRKEKFIDLIIALDEVEGIDRFRISSIEPNLLTNEIIEFVAKSNRFVPHFHIPLQSGSNKILQLMKRRYSTEFYHDQISTIKQLLPNACIGADVIVGFPGETEEDFMNSYTFINELNVSYLHVFTYSERPNTLAEKMEGVVPVYERHQRGKMLRNLSEKKRRRFYEENLGKTETVLFENDIERGMIHGFTRNYIRVAARNDPSLINEIKSVTLTRINANGFVDVAEKETISL